MVQFGTVPGKCEHSISGLRNLVWFGGVTDVPVGLCCGLWMPAPYGMITCAQNDTCRLCHSLSICRVQDSNLFSEVEWHHAQSFSFCLGGHSPNREGIKRLQTWPH